MRTCPSCGFANADEASRCQQCGRLLAQPEPPAPESEPAAAPAAVPIPAPPVFTAPATPPPASGPPPPMFPPPPAPPGYPPGMLPPGPPYPAYPPQRPYPMMSPVPPPPRPLVTSGQKWRRFLGGLGLGLIPALIAGVAIGIGTSNSLGTQNSSSVLSVGLLAAGVLYLAAFIAMIVCLSITRVRFIGYGLLAAVVGAPVILAVGCVVIITSLSRPA